MLLRGSRDGFSSEIFHKKCDKKGRIFAIVLDTEGNKFGAYTDVDFEYINHKDIEYYGGN